jgi:hypothetical protein
MLHPNGRKFMQLSKARYGRFSDGMPYLDIIINGREARILYEQKMTPFQYGIVFVGGEFEEELSVVLPADPSDGRLEPVQL